MISTTDSHYIYHLFHQDTICNKSIWKCTPLMEKQMQNYPLLSIVTRKTESRYVRVQIMIPRDGS
jgi:hypothetical protein